MIHSSRFAPRCLLFFSFFLFPFSLARGALDSETTTPYHLQVVLRIAENRLLTPVFRDLVERELHDSLQAALGDLARVDIVRQHPLLKEVEAKGLKLALDGYSVLSDTKTHFVLVDFIDGRYEIQARQHDGFTGLASPVVRHSSTAYRPLVARSAALLIDQDFGLAGTVEHIQGNRVNVKLKGGGLGASLGHWLRKDQVFAVTQITQGSAQQHRSFGRMSWTLLQVLEEPRGEVCRCRLWSRWDDPLPQGPSVLGYRCLKLGTTQANLRLRVVKNDNLTPIPAVQVHISARGFDFNSELDKKATKQDGLLTSDYLYENVAFVTIKESESILARVPVEIIQDLTITCPVKITAESAAQGELLFRRGQWFRRVNDGLEVANILFRELNAMAGQSSENALARAQAGLKTLQSDLISLSVEQDSLRADAKENPKATPLQLKKGEDGLRQLQELHDKLQGWIGELQGTITEEKDPRRQKWKNLVTQAKIQEERAEFANAIELYKQVLAEGGDTPVLRAKLEGLTKAWSTKNKEHDKARSFIYETWTKLETAAQMNARLDEARKAFLTCKEAGDTLSPQKLLKAYVTHTDRLAKEGDALQLEGEDDRKTAQLIIDLTDKLKEFNEQVKEYLRQAQPTRK